MERSVRKIDTIFSSRKTSTNTLYAIKFGRNSVGGVKLILIESIIPAVLDFLQAGGRSWSSTQYSKSPGGCSVKSKC